MLVSNANTNVCTFKVAIFDIKTAMPTNVIYNFVQRKWHIFSRYRHGVFDIKKNIS